MTRVEVTLPRYHAGQEQVAQDAKRYRFRTMACGRRWGKTTFIGRRIAERVLLGHRFGYFGADYKTLDDAWRETRAILKPITVGSNATDRRIEVVTGGIVEFWTLENDNAGRSRKYHEVAIDEAGIVANLESIWHAAIRPTLADYRGEAWFAGTPKGRNFFHTAFSFGQDDTQADWGSWHMPTVSNPYIPSDEVEEARLTTPDRLFRQEYLAEFLEDAGGVFQGVRQAVRPYDGVPEQPITIGIDVARVEDFTVCCALDAKGRQVGYRRLNQVSWDRIADEIHQFISGFPNATVWVDATGVGDPIYDRIRKENPEHRVNAYKFTSQSKGALMDNLAMRIENGGVTLRDIPEQTNELLAYQYTISQSRNVKMGAPSGMHDDTVCALALAAWGLTNRRVLHIY